MVGGGDICIVEIEGPATGHIVYLLLGLFTHLERRTASV